jgi:DNA-binding CsgD family transcriptional regulator
MANRLTMAQIDTIVTLHKSGHSNRRIAALTGIHLETVARHVRQAASQNRPNAPTGSGNSHPIPT